MALIPLLSGCNESALHSPDDAFLPSDLSAVVDLAMSESTAPDLSSSPDIIASCFRGESHYGPIAAPTSVALGDLNGDGSLDVATADTLISIMLGNGKGMFAAPTSYDGDCADTIAVDDLDSDGHPDVIVPDSCRDVVLVFLGKGDGTLNDALAYPTDRAPSDIAVRDLDGDGKPDLATANRNANSVSILLGMGDGSFRGHVDYPLGEPDKFSPTSIAVCDFNEDGIPDVTINSDNLAVRVLLGNGDGNGDGTLMPAKESSTPLVPFSVACGDLNGDGRVDLAVGDAVEGVFPQYVQILVGKGDGTFEPSEKYSTAGWQASRAALRDLNGDGSLDVIVALPTEGGASVLLNKGDGTLTPATFFATESGSVGVAVGDVDYDGWLDLITANFEANNISVLLNCR